MRKLAVARELAAAADLGARIRVPEGFDAGGADGVSHASDDRAGAVYRVAWDG